MPPSDRAPPPLLRQPDAGPLVIIPATGPFTQGQCFRGELSYGKSHRTNY